MPFLVITLSFVFICLILFPYKVDMLINQKECCVLSSLRSMNLNIFIV